MQLSYIYVEPTFMKAQKMPNLFGHARIQYFIESAMYDILHLAIARTILYIAVK